MAQQATLEPGDAMTTTFVVDEIRTMHELEALRSTWDQLAGPAAEPMQTHAWTCAAAHALHAGAPLRILAVRRGAALAAVAPLVEVVRRGVRWLEFAGAAQLYEPVRMLADSDDAREVLCRAIAAQNLPLRLQRVDGSAWTKALRGAARGRAVAIESASCSCLRVELDASAASGIGRLSSERDATLRRKRRQLEKLGNVVLESVEPGAAEVESVLREAFAVEMRSWKGAAGSAVLQQPAQFEFFRELGRFYAARGALLVRRLRVGAEIAAVHVGVVVERCCYELKIGFDEKFARQSPGVLLTQDCLRDGARRGFRAHEFLGCAAAWQEPFAPTERHLRNVTIYPYSMRGLSALALDGADVAARRAAGVVSGPLPHVARFSRDLAALAKQRWTAARGRWFDWRNRVDTDRRIAVAELRIDSRLARHAVHYEATSIPKFEHAMRLLGHRADGFTFVDLGSGKGRVLMLAALRPFRRVIGVEISRRLHDAAVANVAAFSARNLDKSAPIECLCADASVHELPEGDVAVFLYNPFDAALLAQARDRMLSACARSARKLCVIYVNPLHHVLFENDEFTCDHRDSSLAVYWYRGPAGADT
jgi:CelD/BcsL family acetyltransferase involved in cellulose biosynthesis